MSNAERALVNRAYVVGMRRGVCELRDLSDSSPTPVEHDGIPPLVARARRDRYLVGKHVTRNLGRALRRAREARGFSLRDASRSSGGRFTPSGIAGYERGERRISVERLCALADLYGVRPDRLLADALRAPGALGIDLDLSAVAELSPEVRHLIAGFIEEVLAMRGESGADRISLRSGDLEIIAGTSGSSAIELLRRIREAIADDARQPPR